MKYSILGFFPYSLYISLGTCVLSFKIAEDVWIIIIAIGVIAIVSIAIVIAKLLFGAMKALG